MLIKKFEEIESWKEARELNKLIYEITKAPKFSKDFGLKDQIQRASVSIMANISEGFNRGSKKYFINFLNFANGSASEVESLLYVALDQSYLNEKEFQNAYQRIEKIKKMIGGFIQYLKKN